MLFLLCTFFILILLVKFLNLFDSPAKPKVYHSGSDFAQKVLSRCTSLVQVYHPPRLWGKCGHVQTAIYGKLGRMNCPSPAGQRYAIIMDSGETVTYDVFEPAEKAKAIDCSTILVCPGICNSSEKKYIRTFVQYAVDRNFRVAVLNHIGTLSNVKLTSPKIFTYGETKYFASMVKEMMTAHPESVYIIVGFSMGGNIIARYLGEDKSRQKSILCALSLCQGYDGFRSTVPMTQGYRRIYNYLVTLNFKKVLKPHWKELFHVNDSQHVDNVKLFNEKKVQSATCLRDIEDGLLRHFGGFSTCDEYIHQCGCAHMLENIDIPILLLNSEDDPLVVSEVHDVPLNYSRKKENALFVTTKHGGHLGFYEGSWYRPNNATLLESFIMEYVKAVLDIKLS